MRVEYTIPGWDPASRATVGETSAAAGGFGPRLRRMNRGIPPTADRLLRVHQPPVSAATLGPPPRPLALEVGDAVDERQAWHEMLHRLPKAGAEEAGGLPEASRRNVERMLGLLLEYQRLQDEVVARMMTVRGV